MPLTSLIRLRDQLWPVWMPGPRYKYAKLLATLRHPWNSRKRKMYRHKSSRLSELGKFLRPVGNSAFSRVQDGTTAQAKAIARMRTAGYVDIGGARPMSLSAIIPNYNHGRFLGERIRSILAQGDLVSELIILDDASTDDSREVISQATKNISLPVVTAFNDVNSGKIFSQWVKGISLARGELIWICESDDTCDAGFLQALAPYFSDESIMLAFGQIDFVDEGGNRHTTPKDQIDEVDFWRGAQIESAYSWFQGPFAARNVIANVGGCVFRNQPIGPELIADLLSYKICGDWFFYSRLAHGGRIAYDPAARSYFRLHGANTSVASHKTEEFYREHIRIARALRQHYLAAPAMLRRMLVDVWDRCRSTLGEKAANDLARRYSLRSIFTEPRTVEHILIAVHDVGMRPGNQFPLKLANELVKHGVDVSIFVFASQPAMDRVRTVLSGEIPVYSKAFVDEVGFQNFIKRFGVSLINTHDVEIDRWLHCAGTRLSTPYVVSDHGSYENAQLTNSFRAWLKRNVDYWMLTQDKSGNGLSDIAGERFRNSTSRAALEFGNDEEADRNCAQDYMTVFRKVMDGKR